MCTPVNLMAVRVGKVGNTSQVIRDHILSVDPAELRQLVEIGRTLSKMAAFAEDK